jgi:low temperature requirement protein LtrA
MCAYSLSHLLHIAGLVLLAVALHEIVHDPVHHLGWGMAVTGSGGVAAFLVGQACFRSVLGVGPVATLLTAAVLAVVVAPLGVLVSGLGQLLGLAVVAAGLAAVLHRRTGAELEPAGADPTADGLQAT